VLLEQKWLSFVLQLGFCSDDLQMQSGCDCQESSAHEVWYVFGQVDHRSVDTCVTCILKCHCNHLYRSTSKRASCKSVDDMQGKDKEEEENEPLIDSHDNDDSDI